ncbi:MAG: type II toxin-antitoxin system death-on-curing family toxin [Sulfitobacter sp.]
MFTARIDEGEEVLFLTLEHVEFCHRKALELHPNNMAGTKSLEALESALIRPQQFHHYESENDLVKLAAVVWHGIGCAHGYNDANKRTAFISAFTFLEMNGIEVCAPPDEPGHFTETLFRVGENGRNQFEIDNLEDYLRPRARWIISE